MKSWVKKEIEGQVNRLQTFLESNLQAIREEMKPKAEDSIVVRNQTHGAPITSVKTGTVAEDETNGHGRNVSSDWEKWLEPAEQPVAPAAPAAPAEDEQSEQDDGAMSNWKEWLDGTDSSSSSTGSAADA